MKRVAVVPTCGVDSSAEMILPSVALVSGAEQNINLFNLS